VPVRLFREMIRSWRLWPNVWSNPLMGSNLNRLLGGIGLVRGSQSLGMCPRRWHLTLALPVTAVLPGSHEMNCSTMPSPPWWSETSEIMSKINLSFLKLFLSGFWSQGQKTPNKQTNKHTNKKNPQLIKFRTRCEWSFKP
jgi:hypothetical protein